MLSPFAYSNDNFRQTCIQSSESICSQCTIITLLNHPPQESLLQVFWFTLMENFKKLKKILGQLVTFQLVICTKVIHSTILKTIAGFLSVVELLMGFPHSHFKMDD